MLKAKSKAIQMVDECGPFFNHFPDCDLIICTDMGTEPADFILSSQWKICFVHVKSGTSTSPMSSAGSIATVGSQAIKNVEATISKDTSLKPANWNLLHQRWPYDNSEYFIEDRIRLINNQRASDFMQEYGITSKEELVNKAWEILAERRASYACSKEIWLVVGNAFSQGHFFNQVKKGNKALGESLQAYQLIDSWFATAMTNDIEFRIFASP
jgi:hypothetical protein